ncbi:cysteine-rich secretory protein 1-like [Psammomys obesus]|uniref:cysteine-rich secretory protein 1-like n=1 Tax=Psammomys obesus TaxID=48139 RepID=UPI002452CA6F|nr:cysteine-rich secretory protein 1-like [Psammomys obesus]
MALFPALLFLAAVLPSSLLQDNCENKDLEDLSTTLKSVQEEIVNKHNQLRRMVSPPGSDLLKMQWNHDAQRNAQSWANKCMYHHSPEEFRTIDKKCGENIFMANYLTSWSSVIQNWFDEYNDFVIGFGPNKPGAKVGHYTQIVWNSTYQVACGIAECPENPLNFFYVCHYCPAGNYERRLYTPYTEGEPCALCPNDCEDRLCTNSCEYIDNYSNCEDMKKYYTCEDPTVKRVCQATCDCEDKIH